MRNKQSDELVRLIKHQLSLAHTSLPGKIVSFDASTCRATVKPPIMYFTADGRSIEYPLITGVPVFMPKAGASQITYPVKPGDSCWIIFSERSLDEWLGSGSSDNHDPRQFDLTDAVCFVGMCPAQSISAENVEIINKGTLISVTPSNKVNIIGEVNIKGNVHVEGNYTCSGRSRMSGNIDCDGDVTASGTSLHGHTHGCPHGGSTSAPN